MYVTLVYTPSHGINFCPCNKCLECIPNVCILSSSSKSQVLAQAPTPTPTCLKDKFI